MEIQLDREDIIREVKENHINEADFFYEIVDAATTDYEPIRELVRRLIWQLRTQDDAWEFEKLVNELKK